MLLQAGAVGPSTWGELLLTEAGGSVWDGGQLSVEITRGGGIWPWRAP